MSGGKAENEEPWVLLALAVASCVTLSQPLPLAGSVSTSVTPEA